MLRKGQNLINIVLKNAPIGCATFRLPWHIVWGVIGVIVPGKMCILWMRYLWISLIEVRPVSLNSLLYIKSGRSKHGTIAERYHHGTVPCLERPDFYIQQTCLAGANCPAAGHSVFDRHRNSADSRLADSKDRSIERNNLLGNPVPL